MIQEVVVNKKGKSDLFAPIAVVDRFGDKPYVLEVFEGEDAESVEKMHRLKMRDLDKPRFTRAQNNDNRI